VAAVVDALKSLFGAENVPAPTAHVITRWRSDPYSRGSYSYLPPGSHGVHYDLMAAPLDNKVFFAGEATNRVHPTTAAGAFDSGIREAVRLSSLFGRARDTDVERLLSARAARLQRLAALEAGGVNVTLAAIEAVAPLRPSARSASPAVAVSGSAGFAVGAAAGGSSGASAVHVHGGAAGAAAAPPAAAAAAAPASHAAGHVGSDADAASAGGPGPTVAAVAPAATSLGQGAGVGDRAVTAGDSATASAPAAGAGAAASAAADEDIEMGGVE
jgi:lysine-specific histone demethylase 1